MKRILLLSLSWIIVLCIFGCKPNRADVPPPKPQIFYDFPYKTVVPIERF